MFLRHCRRKLRSSDPRRNAILARIRWVFRHLRPDERLVFFDTKPVAVQAYGGPRYTAARKLVLPLRQKTRGRFHLFLLYDPTSGRVHWQFRSGKDSTHISAWMRQLRRWYPAGPVWVVLDQDTAHPKKSFQTRRTMRQLHLHWISLPKASPDDHPVETLNSDIQRTVLHCSNDPDVRTTQRRISARLRGRNRRSDRWIKIPYLPDSAKG